MADDKLIKTVQTTFDMYGLVLSRKLSAALAKQLLNIQENERDTRLTDIVEKVLTQNLNDRHVEIQHLKLAIEECVRPDTLTSTETVLNVINAFDIPKVMYNLNRKKFVLWPITHDFFPEAEYKTYVFKHRFELLWYRLLRHEIFTPPKLGENMDNKIELIPIEYLLSESKKGYVCVMGLLAQLTEGQYYLEDTGGTIKLDLTRAKFQDGLIMEGSIVIANGEYKDDFLYVDDIGFPPPELSSNSRAEFGDANTFGGTNKVSLKLSEKLKAHEESNKDGMIVFVSELWLDDLTVLQKFKVMLQGYSEFPPIAFVLCGHFLSFSPTAKSGQALKDGFRNLAEIIVQFPNINESSKFIFVPAPEDLGSPKILPRISLPKHVTEDFRKSVANAIFATNPCRIQYCTKEIVVMREDVLTKMCRNTIHFPKNGNIFDHFAKSVISQSHLAPVNLSVIPIHWKYDHCLQLHPTPDLIVIADQFEAFATTYSNCNVINPGLFPKNQHSFKVYIPSLDLIEDCAIPKDVDDV